MEIVVVMEMEDFSTGMNNFQTSELTGRDKFKMILDYHNTDCYFTSGEYDVYDAYYFDNENNKYIVEIKDRQVSHTAYKDFVFEVDKYNRLRYEMQRNNQIKGIYYVNFFTDNYFAVWDVTLIDQTPILKSCRRHTAINTGYKDKMVYLLELNNAVTVGKITINGIKYEPTKFTQNFSKTTLGNMDRIKRDKQRKWPDYFTSYQRDFKRLYQNVSRK